MSIMHPQSYTSAGIVTIDDHRVTDAGIGDAEYQSDVIFTKNGFITNSKGTPAPGFDIDAEWIGPKFDDVGALYQILFEKTGGNGTPVGPALDTWHDLDSDQTQTLTRALGAGVGLTNAILDCSIRRKGTTNVLEVGEIELYCERIA